MKPYKLAKIYDANGDVKKRWYVYFYLRRNDGTWKREREFITTKAKTRNERYLIADDMIKAINELLVTGQLTLHEKKQKIIQAVKPEITAAINEAFEALEKELGKESFVIYRSTGRRLIKYIESLGVELYADEFNSKMAAKYMLLNYAGKNANTYNNALAYLKTIFEKIDNFYEMEENPFARLKRKTVAEPETKAWPLAELFKFFNYTKDHEKQLYLYSILIFQSFLRHADLWRLKKEHLGRLDQNIILLPGKETKNKRTKPVTVSNEAKELLLHHAKEMDLEDFIFSKQLKPGKEQLNADNIGYLFIPIRKKLKIPEYCTLYKLKHTGNTIADQLLNIAPRDLQQQNRHATFAQTETYIGKLSLKANQSFVNFPTIDELRELTKSEK